MANIAEYLKQILSARYGRDVRQAIHDGIQQCYYDGKAGAIDMQARENIDVIEENLDEVEAIAKGRNRARVFTTTESMNEWLADANNKGVANVGDNLYIVAIDVPDWWIAEVLEEPNENGMYYEVAQLETQKVDLTTIEAAIAENANAIEEVNSNLSTKKIEFIGHTNSTTGLTVNYDISEYDSILVCIGKNNMTFASTLVPLYNIETFGFTHAGVSSSYSGSNYEGYAIIDGTKITVMMVSNNSVILSIYGIKH